MNFSLHVNHSLATCNQSLFALRMLRHHGLDDRLIHQVYDSKILTKLLYALPSWWGFLSQAAKNQLESFVRKSCKLNYCKPAYKTISEIAKQLDLDLFQNITANTNHCLHHLLPPIKQTHYNLRAKGHNFTLPTKDDRNFLHRCLFNFL